MRNKFVLDCTWCCAELGVDDANDGFYPYLISLNGVKMYFCNEEQMNIWIGSRIERAIKDAIFVLTPDDRDGILNNINSYV